MKFTKLILLFSCLQLSLSAQEVLSKIPAEGKKINDFIPKNYDTIEVVKGDLNKDGVDDVVMALHYRMEDTFAMDEAPKRILVILINLNGVFKLAGKSENILMCRECGGVFGDPYNGIVISKGVLSVNHYGGSAWRWLDVQKFRYQQSSFCLIGSTNDYYWNVSDCNGNGVGDAGRKFKDVNWVTGVEEVIERDENCRLIKQTKQKIKRSSLIKLENFEHE